MMPTANTSAERSESTWSAMSFADVATVMRQSRPPSSPVPSYNRCSSSLPTADAAEAGYHSSSSVRAGGPTSSIV